METESLPLHFNVILILALLGSRRKAANEPLVGNVSRVQRLT